MSFRALFCGACPGACILGLRRSDDIAAGVRNVPTKIRVRVSRKVNDDEDAKHKTCGPPPHSPCLLHMCAALPRAAMQCHAALICCALRPLPLPSPSSLSSCPPPPLTRRRSYASVSLVPTPKGKDDRLDWMPKHFKGLATQKVDEEAA